MLLLRTSSSPSPSSLSSPSPRRCDLMTRESHTLSRLSREAYPAARLVLSAVAIGLCLAVFGLACSWTLGAFLHAEMGLLFVDPHVPHAPLADRSVLATSAESARFGGPKGEFGGKRIWHGDGVGFGEPPLVVVTGGAGYIGSHTCVELLLAGYQVAVLDNFGNSRECALRRVQRLVGPPKGKLLTWHRLNVRNRTALRAVFCTLGRVTAVIHFAGLKAVAESVAQPVLYYDNNVVGTLHLLEAMAEHGCRTLVFSSSATVYGEPARAPCVETDPLHPSSPYGRTKLMVEDMLRDMHEADSKWRIIILRYFNPVGAHPSGLLGEDPRGVPNNLMPLLTQAGALSSTSLPLLHSAGSFCSSASLWPSRLFASSSGKVLTRKRSHVVVYGADYATRDGTPVRDYCHVVDLAAGHLAALRHANSSSFSVLELIEAMEAAAGATVPRQVAARRPGDTAVTFASTEKAAAVLKWRAVKSLREMCEDQWRWAKNSLAVQSAA
eukprot:jgi/Mesen1/8819/ME000053S08225